MGSHETIFFMCAIFLVFKWPFPTGADNSTHIFFQYFVGCVIFPKRILKLCKFSSDMEHVRYVLRMRNSIQWSIVVWSDGNRSSRPDVISLEVMSPWIWVASPEILVMSPLRQTDVDLLSLNYFTNNRYLRAERQKRVFALTFIGYF